MLGMMI